MSNQQELELTIKELKLLNYNAYLAATFALKQDFAKIVAIFLLQSELKKIIDIANDNMIGLIRIAWWKENLEDIFLHNKTKNHHLLKLIASFKEQINFQKLKVALEAFELDFAEEKLFKSKADLNNYIAKTYGIFFEIIAEILQINDCKIAKNLAQISFYCDFLQKIKQEDEKIVRFFYPNFFSELKIDAAFWQKNNSAKNYDENLVVIVKYIVDEIEILAQELAILEKNMPKKAKNIMLQKELILLILQNLKKNNFDIFAADLNAKTFLMKVKFFWRCFKYF